MASRSYENWAEPRTSRWLKQVAPHLAVRNVTGRAPLAITQWYGRPAPALAGSVWPVVGAAYLSKLSRCMRVSSDAIRTVRKRQKTRS